MVQPQQDQDEQAARVEAFWRLAREHARLTTVPAYFGVTALEAVTPPAWSFGATPEQADALLALVLTGTKTATSSALWDYEAADEALPVPGTMGIILDGAGRPRALVATTAVTVVPFEEVDEEHAWLEGEGDRSLAHWRAVHERFFTEHAEHEQGFDPTMPVVLERFELLHAG
jgi:uncharacterized protein YhfF